MTRFYINEREITPPQGIVSFDKILSHIDEDELPPNSVIRMVSIDGMPILQEDFSRNSEDINRQIFSGEKVEIVTGTVDEIIHDSISEAFEYIERLNEGIPQLALNFQTYPAPEAFEYLRQLYEGFYWLNILQQKLVANFDIDFNTVLIQGKSAKEHQQNYISILKKLQDAQESRDTVLIADLLEYEIAPMISVWKELLQIIAVRTGEA